MPQDATGDGDLKSDYQSSKHWTSVTKSITNEIHELMNKILNKSVAWDNTTLLMWVNGGTT